MQNGCEHNKETKENEWKLQRQKTKPNKIKFIVVIFNCVGEAGK